MQNVTAFIPVVRDIPGPWGWILTLQFCTFVLHLFFMNAVVGVAIIAVWKTFRGAAAEGLFLAYPLPKGLALVVNLGVAPLLFVQVTYGAFIYSSSILIALWWLSIMMTVMLAYYGLYVYTTPGAFSPKSRAAALVISVLLLLATAFIQVNNATLMQHPHLWTAYATNPGGSLLHLSDPQIWPRFLHVILSCLAVGGLCIAVPAHLKLRFLARANAPLPQQQPLYLRLRTGLRWYFHATCLQIFVGGWFFMTLNHEQQRMFTGGNIPATVLYGGNFVLVLAALVTAKKERPVSAAVLTGLVIICMSAVRGLVRSSMLNAVFEPHMRTGEGGPAWVFVGSLIFTLAIIVWMVRVYRRAI